MHDAVVEYVAGHIPSGVSEVLEFGSRNINGSVRPLVGDVARFVGVDIADGPGVDIVADAGHVVVPGRFDLVVCTEVFEHADDDACQAMVTNAHTHLRDGGTFIATMAGPGRPPHSAVDGGGLRPYEFYRNVDEALLTDWLKAAGFDRFDVNRNGADMRCVAVKGEG